MINPTIGLALSQEESLDHLRVMLWSFVQQPIKQPEESFIRPLTHQERYLLAIYQKTLKRGLKHEDFELLARIARAESSLRQFSECGNVLRGKQNPMDVGIFQINEGYHLKDSRKLGYDIHQLEGNIKFALHLYVNEGSRPWNWSRWKWDR